MGLRRAVRCALLVMAAIAVGRKGNPAQLPEDLREMESPNTRNPLKEIAREWQGQSAG